MRRYSFLTAAIAMACARPAPVVEPAPSIVQQGSASAPRGRFSNHVVVVSIDGLRPDAIARFKAPTLTRLMHEGRYSLSAQTIALSLTLPSHTSMLTGVDSDQHGVTWNAEKTATRGFVAVPTIFGLARSAGFTTAAFFSKTKFQHLEVPSTLDFARGPRRGPMPWSSAHTVELVQRYLKQSSPNLLFVHLADVDFAGHTFGWMGHTYGMAVREVDRSLTTLVGTLDEKYGAGHYTLIVTADHGGHGTTHGTTDRVDTTIPWIVWGAGVQHGDTLSGVRTMDTAATTLWMLGVGVPANWTGRALTDAFDPSLSTEP
jgi:predicted AlkP superfamily pyrophosphatase or phosphodiesterase